VLEVITIPISSVPASTDVMALENIMTTIWFQTEIFENDFTELVFLGYCSK
jgi:hypothetical protein